jgi:hypothetical protein
MNLGQVANYLTLFSSLGVVVGGLLGVGIAAIDPADVPDGLNSPGRTWTYFANIATGITCGWSLFTLLWMIAAAVGGQL